MSVDNFLCFFRYCLFKNISLQYLQLYDKLNIPSWNILYFTVIKVLQFHWTSVHMLLCNFQLFLLIVIHLLLHFGENKVGLSMFYCLWKECDTCANTFWRNKSVSQHVWLFSFANMWSMCIYVLEKRRCGWACLKILFWKKHMIHVLKHFGEINVCVIMFEDFLLKTCDSSASKFWRK